MSGVLQDPRLKKERIKTRALTLQKLDRPEVIEAIMRGEPIHRIAKREGLPDYAVYDFMRRLPMEVLLESESKRVMLHLSRRKLDREKYLALSTALSTFIEKTRLLRDESTEILETRETGKAERLAKIFEIESGSVSPSAEPDQVNQGDEGAGAGEVLFTDDCAGEAGS